MTPLNDAAKALIATHLIASRDNTIGDVVRLLRENGFRVPPRAFFEDVLETAGFHLQLTGGRTRVHTCTPGTRLVVENDPDAYNAALWKAVADYIGRERVTRVEAVADPYMAGVVGVRVFEHADGANGWVDFLCSDPKPTEDVLEEVTFNAWPATSKRWS